MFICATTETKHCFIAVLFQFYFNCTGTLVAHKNHVFSCSFPNFCSVSEVPCLCRTLFVTYFRGLLVLQRPLPPFHPVKMGIITIVVAGYRTSEKYFVNKNTL